MRVIGTPEAVEAVSRVRAVRHGDLVFTVGNGCCDSTALFLFEDHLTVPDAVSAGEMAGVPVSVPRWFADAYADQAMRVDVVEDTGTDSFSVESELGLRFVLVSLDGDDAGACPDRADRSGQRDCDEPAGRSASAPADHLGESSHAPRTPELPDLNWDAAPAGLRQLVALRRGAANSDDRGPAR